MWTKTQAEQLAQVPNLWERQYGAHTYYANDPDKQRILQELKALKPEELIPETIDHIIGNCSWTTFMCSECCDSVTKVITFDVNGGEYEHSLCEKCIKNATKQLKAI